MDNHPQPQKARLRRLNIRLSQPEWDKVHKLSSNTTCRSVSEYARKVLSDKPVKVFYRNQSFDDFEEQMLTLLPQLEAFGDNFGQLAKKLSSVDPAADIKALLPPLLDAAKGFNETAEKIRTHIENLSDHATKNNPLS
jgi:MobC-like protein